MWGYQVPMNCSIKDTSYCVFLGHASCCDASLAFTESVSEACPPTAGISKTIEFFACYDGDQCNIDYDESVVHLL